MKPYEKITAICPRCRKVHSLRLGGQGCDIKWIGNGIPRKYCANCKAVIAKWDYQELNEYSYKYDH